MPPGLGTPPQQPSRARMISYWLGGIDHTDADRAEAAAIEHLNPAVRRMLANSSLFAVRATGWAIAENGIGHVIDMNAGFPAPDSIHQAARHVRPDTRIAYVTGDPEVTDRWDGLLEEHPVPGVAAVGADFTDPDAVLGDPQLKAAIEAGAPVCLLFTLALNTMPPAKARRLVAGYVRRIAPGSLVAISCPRIDDPRMQAAVAATWTAWQGWNFTRAEVGALFGGMELVPPGIVPAANLRPGWESARRRPPGPAYVIAGIGRKAVLAWCRRAPCHGDLLVLVRAWS